MTTVATMIDNANGRATETLNSARQAILDAVTTISSSMGGPGTALANLPALLAPNETAAGAAPDQPVFVAVAMAPTPDPTEPQSLQDIEQIDTGGEPSNTAVYDGYKAPNDVAALEPFVDKHMEVKTDFTFPEPPPELLQPRFIVPVLKDLPSPKMGSYNIPHFSAGVPTFTDHALPPGVHVNITPFTGTAPPLGNFAALGGAPTFTAPSLDANLPSDTTVAPAGLAYALESVYADMSPSMSAAIGGYLDAELLKINPQYQAQMGAIESQITTYLNGGTGLKPAVEDAIYTRARSKNNAEALRVRDQALNDFAARGFTLPGGALFSAVQQGRQAGADANAKAATEIVVMQAEMEQKNIQFALTTSVGLRKMAMDVVMSYMQTLGTINGQAIDVAKSTVNALVETYNIQVRNYGQKIEAFKAQLSIYGAQVQAALAPIEGYKAEVQAYTAELQTDLTKANVFQSQVSAYDASIKAALAPVEIYKANISGVQAAIGAEANKANLFSSQVGAFEAETKASLIPVTVYQAEVEGFKAGISEKTASVELYKSEVEGKQALAKMYQVQVEAITSQISLEKLKIDIFESQVKAFSAQVQAKDAEYKAYMAAIEGEDAKVKAYQAQVQEYSTEVQAWKNKIDGQIAIQEATARSNDARAKQYSSYVSTLQTLIQARSAKAQAEHDVHKVQSTDYQARIAHAVAQFNQTREFVQAQSSIDLENHKVQLETLLEQTRNIRAFQQVMGGMLQSTASTSGQLAASALSGMNTIVSQSMAE